MKNIFFTLFAILATNYSNAQIINFPDANFKAKLLSANQGNAIAFNSSYQPMVIDTNGNDEIEVFEAMQVYQLEIPYYSFMGGQPISNLDGIQWFINLIKLNCDGNSLTELNLNSLTKLQDLRCVENQLTSLQITGCNDLNHILCYSNNLSVIDCSGLSKLMRLNCSFNSLTSINVSDSPVLTQLACDYVSTLTTIDVSNNPLLAYLYATHCPQLTAIFAKNGSDESYAFDFSDSPNVKYICADESQLTAIQNKINSYGYVNCFVNSYCSFTPGGTFYTVQGNSKYDLNVNGCDALDFPLPNLKYSITNGTVTGALTANSSGNYNIPIQGGNHTIRPLFENPSYFIVSPASVTVSFPAQVSPLTQNFCITSTGIHPDLEVVVLTIIPAMPGFDATYKIIYKNKGNTTQSGTVSITFNDAVSDFVSASPTQATQTINNLSWNFTNLLPFETREITFTLNVNSPMETPAVNNGDVLNYTATITSAATDDMPNDNTFVLNQTVVNSYDPNDKTCLEGTTITPEKVGEYVHYMIRFENTGTANAQNIVVKDMIDTTKFDVSSLVPMKGSHSFITNISSGNKVEFIFENINLPFDDANNDGYVAFKIKTKPTLVNGDTFSNTASIYFDYNFPIITNTATTTIAALNNQDFEFSNYFTLYPNPVHDVLHIDGKEAIAISSVSIYNALGQLVVVIPNAQNTKTIDVSNLTTGHYFIKVNSDKGTSNTKFIKQ